MLKIEINNFFYARFIQDKVHEVAAREESNFHWFDFDGFERFYALVQ
jgi:hypothetical protein